MNIRDYSSDVRSTKKRITVEYQLNSQWVVVNVSSVGK